VTFTLNIDATVISPPFGIVAGGLTLRMYFDATGKLITTAGVNKIWSNAELNPQTSGSLLGTWYTVNFYDQNGARLNELPQTWVFTQPNGATVDIGTMTAINVPGIIYFPFQGSNVDTILTFLASQTIPTPALGQNFYCECTGGVAGITLAMPPAASLAGQTVKLIKVDTGVGAVTLTGGESGTYALTNHRQFVNYESDGSVWNVWGNN
jgi:hypothetical protein